jgi:hypothetical protein
MIVKKLPSRGTKNMRRYIRTNIVPGMVEDMVKRIDKDILERLFKLGGNVREY